MIKRTPLFLLVLLAAAVPKPLQAQDKKPATLREVLLAELRSTHTNSEWFVPANTAVKGFDAKTWNETVKQLDEVMSELQKWVETADEAKLKESAQVFTHISTHNAYHIGQMIYVRKEQGSWDPKNGVN